MIKPTIGRVVLYKDPDSEQPVPALITYVYSDRMINIGGFNKHGTPFCRTSVTLCQDDERPDNYDAFWMPYQKEVAAKSAAEKV